MLERIEAELGGSPQLLLAYGTPQRLHDAAKVLLRQRYPACVHGATSCQGVVDREGFHGGAGGALAVLAIRSEAGACGVAAAPFLSGDAAETAVRTLRTALNRAERPGEVPDLVWISSAPGCEERVVTALESELGPECEIIGGSAADDDVSGRWAVMSGEDGVISDGLVITVLFTSRPLATAFHSGYEPTSQTWTVTRAHGRHLAELDGKPAAEEYDRATGGLVSRMISDPQVSLLQLSTMSPLGRAVSSIGATPMYLLSQPAHATPQGAIELFSEVSVGEKVTLMESTPDLLLNRPAKVVRAALDQAGMDAADVAGAMLIFCGGCMLAVRDRLDEIALGVKAVLPQTPFLCTFTFGEQGSLLGGSSHHGNLMNSCVLFPKS